MNCLSIHGQKKWNGLMWWSTFILGLEFENARMIIIVMVGIFIFKYEFYTWTWHDDVFFSRHYPVLGNVLFLHLLLCTKRCYHHELKKFKEGTMEQWFFLGFHRQIVIVKWCHMWILFDDILGEIFIVKVIAIVSHERFVFVHDDNSAIVSIYMYIGWW